MVPDPSLRPDPLAGWSTESLIPARDIQEVLKWSPPEPVQPNVVAPPPGGAHDAVPRRGSGINFALPTAFAVVITAIAVIVWLINPWFAVSVYVIGAVFGIYGALKYFSD